MAPNLVRNTDYTSALAGVLHRPALLPVPSFGPRLLLGAQGARELAEASQRVVPAEAASAGHRFRQPLSPTRWPISWGTADCATRSRNPRTRRVIRTRGVVSDSAVRERNSSWVEPPA